MVPSKTNVVVELEIKRGLAMKKSNQLHNYIPVTLVLLSDKLLIFHTSIFSADCSISLSVVLSASIDAESSISFYHGISQDCSFCVYTVEQVYKLRVDNTSTATKWAEIIIHTRDKQKKEADKNRALKDIVEGEAFTVTTDTSTSSLPSVKIKNRESLQSASSCFSNKQIEALLAFERLIDSDDNVSKYVATAFFDCSSISTRQQNNQEKVNDNTSNNMSQLLGTSIVHWLLGTSMIASTIVPEEISHEPILSKFVVSNVNETMFITEGPTKSAFLQQWIHACVSKEFRKFCSPVITNEGLKKFNPLLFCTTSNTGFFIT